MLVELHVRSLGVIDDATLFPGQSMTAITGETGAGKTMLVEALRLLMGGRAEPHVVRTGADEAWIEGRFLDSTGEDHVLSRVIPADGRSRAYVDGRMAPVGALSEVGAQLVEVHAQHGHHALLGASAQRDALDMFAGIDVEPLSKARAHLRDIDDEIAKRGGDEQSRAREIDLLDFQLSEMQSASLTHENEDSELAQVESELASAGVHRQAAATVHASIAGEGNVTDLLARAVHSGAQSTVLSEIVARLSQVMIELDDIAGEAHAAKERLGDDPQRLAQVQERRRVLRSLMRKFGPTLGDVLAFRDEVETRRNELMRHDENMLALDAERETAAAEVARQEDRVRSERKRAAPKLAASVAKLLAELALPNARFEVEVSEDGGGDGVTFLLGANRGMPTLPLSKAASGGELARAMLALRLTLVGGQWSAGEGHGPGTLIFDEVDAGIGGQAAATVGNALARLADSAGVQVLVVTHLPQVAAAASTHVTVDKRQSATETVAVLSSLSGAEREAELARMLSGRPDSESGRMHARELLEGTTAPARKRTKSKSNT